MMRMDVHAKARFVRMSPRKVRLVVNLLRGLRIPAARTTLAFVPKAAATPVLKALNSAVANAVHNFRLTEADLTVKSATADAGPTLKRWRARAMGRAAPIRKRTTHITIVVTDGKAAVTEPETKKVEAVTKKDIESK